MKLKTLCAIAAALAIGHGAATAQDKPAELKIGISTFTSGPASVFGVPGTAAAELLIEEMNKAGGIGGVKVSPLFIDEGIGGTSCCPSTDASSRNRASGPCCPRSPAATATSSPRSRRT